MNLAVLMQDLRSGRQTERDLHSLGGRKSAIPARLNSAQATRPIAARLPWLAIAHGSLIADT